MPKTHRTVRTPVEQSMAGPNDSRLDARLGPAPNRARADEAVSDHQRQWTVWAWRGHDPQNEESGVRGETHRGLGEAVMTVLASAKLRGVCLVVTRSVASAPLNRRETLRAYRAAAEAAVEAATVVEGPLWTSLTVQVGAHNHAAVVKAVQKHGGRIRGEEARASVTLWLEVAAEDERAVRAAVERAGGRTRD
jgi:putative IMPACT (imprinted ancient) family translation regulator